MRQEKEILSQRLDVARWIAMELAGTISAEDREKLVEWLADSPKHHGELEKIKALIVDENTREAKKEVAVKAWEEFEKRAIHRKRRQLSWLKYAAAMVIPLFVIIYLWRESEELQPDTKSVKLVHGRGRAVLITDQGERISLEQGDSLQIINRNNRLEISLENDLLVYNEITDLTNNEGNIISSDNLSERYNVLEVPIGGEFVLQLSDGTKVWLNADSKITYPLTFQGNTRTVEITGEVFFDVSKDKIKPFIVKVNGVDITVLGTSFNVSAYHDNVITTLVEGKLSIAKGEHQVIISPNEQAISGETGFSVNRVDAKSFALWRDGMFYFNNDRLEDIMESLARWYDAEVFYTDPELRRLRFSVKMRRFEDIIGVLGKIEGTEKVKFDINGKTITVTR